MEPEIDPSVEFGDLDRGARSRLRTLSKDNADGVARHLVMAGRLMDIDAQRAYEHAHAALRRAGRVDIVREAVALTAYSLGHYSEALREFRTVRRLSGVDAHRALEADCERGLQRPERALTLVAGAPADLPVPDQIELALVASGARLDLGEAEAALLVLDAAPVAPTTELAQRVAEHRVTVLRALGREEQAREVERTLPEQEPDEDADVVFYEDET